MIIVLILILLLALFIFMLKPNSRRIDALPARRFAHRGLHGQGVPENSLSAFKKARERGLGVELDVRFTQDKKLVVFHDDNLKRMCGADKNVSELTWEELREYHLLDTEEPIPLFSEVLEALRGMPVICEIKMNLGEPIAALCEAVTKEIADYQGFLCIESFHPFVVQWYKKNRPEIIRGQLSMNFFKQKKSLKFVLDFLMTNLLLNVLSRPDFIAYRFRDDSVGFFLCRKLFKPLHAVWTVRGKEDQAEAEGKFDAVIFEEI